MPSNQPPPRRLRRYQNRIDTPQNWTNDNPVLLEGEFGLEKDTKLFKIGDGVTPWRDLEYGGLKGDSGTNGSISADADNRLRFGTDGGMFVPELTEDLVAHYTQSKV